MKHFLLSLAIFLLIFKIDAQYTVAPSSIRWYDIEKAFELNKKNPRPIIIDVYTDWCSWCKYMMKTTFSHTGIANYINNHFYPVRFNAETMDTIEFQGKKYYNRNVGHHPTHDLANYLLEGRISYPTIVYFDRSGKKIIDPGYKESKDIEPVLIYTVENLSNYVSLQEFRADFMFTFPKSFENDHSIFNVPKELKPDTLGVPVWKKPEEISFAKKKKSKPTIIFFYTDWCISCKVMEKTTFGNRKISNLLNEYFNVIKFDAASQNTISFLGKQYKGTGTGKPHEFARAMLQKDLRMPAVVFMDATGKPLNKLNAFLNVANMEPMLQFFIQKKYETISYADFLKSLNTSSTPQIP
jgi:thioredoxin-related protein